MTQLSCGVRRGSQFNQNNRRDTILDPVYMGHYSDHCIQGRDVFVQLFEWKWQDVATECKHHLGQIGYCAVQVCQNKSFVTKYILFSVNKILIDVDQ